MNIALSSKRIRWLVFLLISVAIVLWQGQGVEIGGGSSESYPTGQVFFQATSTVFEISTSTTSLSLLPSHTSSSLIVTNATVVRVVDGDTIEVRVDGQKDDQKVRFLGVNTPETVDPRRAVQCFGKEASHFTKALLTGRRVRLDPDPEADERDKYARLLRNIILADGTDVNASLVRSGYAYAYVSFPQNKQRKKQLTRLETEAKVLKRGLWADETCVGKK